MIMFYRKAFGLTFLLLLSLPQFTSAQQLNQTFDLVFDSFLQRGFSLSPGNHGSHFIPASREADEQLTPALNSLIASNVSSFPLSSTVAGVTFDFSSGQPVSIRESLGPIFAETAETLGDSKLVAGFNATYLTMDRLRGMPLDEMRFTFLHEDVTSNGALGDNPNESDIVDIFLNLDVNASIFALFATYGVSSNFDVGIAIPFVTVDVSGEARAVVNSFTLGALGQANHHFGDNALAPILVSDTTYEASATGLGDLALRFKYRFPSNSDVRTAALIDVRVPTGDSNNFLGTGNVSVRALFVGSKRIGDFTPHINVGYDYRGAELDSDEIELVLGFDQQIVPGVTFAADFIGEFDLSSNEIELLPGTATIMDQSSSARTTRTIERSNVPDFERDSTLNASLGFRFAPSEQFQLLANTLVPLQNGGLRSNISPTLGFSIVF